MTPNSSFLFDSLRSFGREGDARSCSYATERFTKVQNCPHDRLFEGQERNPSPSKCTEDKRESIRLKLLVERVMCQHVWPGRERYLKLHQPSGETPKATSPIESGAQLTATFLVAFLISRAMLVVFDF